MTQSIHRNAPRLPSHCGPWLVRSGYLFERCSELFFLAALQISGEKGRRAQGLDYRQFIHHVEPSCGQVAILPQQFTEGRVSGKKKINGRGQWRRRLVQIS